MGRETGVESEPLYAAIEAGGTKFRVAIGRSPDLLTDATIPTTAPEETIDACVSFIRDAGYPVAGIGIASFGPLDLRPGSPAYGSMTPTPKPGWEGTDLKGLVEDALGVPAVIDVDVGGAALGEWRWGAGRGCDALLYVTVGTGIGGALLREGGAWYPAGHPEMGHVTVEREPGDGFPGNCPFHGACLEGMATGPAITARWGRPAPELSDRPEVWELEAGYLAQGLQTYVYALAPQRIILGGGVLRHPGLLDVVRDRLIERLSGYGPPLGEGFLVGPQFGQDAGLVGAVALALREYEGT